MSARTPEGPLTLLLTISAGALAWFCISVVDLAAQVLR